MLRLPQHLFVQVINGKKERSFLVMKNSIKLISLVIAAVMLVLLVAGCSTPKETSTSEDTTLTETTVITTQSESTDPVNDETTETTVVTETTATVTETTASDEEEIPGVCEGVWRAEKVIVSPSGSSKDVEYDVSAELISIFLEEGNLYLGSTDNIKQEYTRKGSCAFKEYSSGKEIIISMFSLATGRSLTATYYYRMYKDKWGTVKLELRLDSMNGDATMFGFNSFMNEQHIIVLSEWGFAKADSEHDPELYRSHDTRWTPTFGTRKEELRFTYGDNFIVYIDNQIGGTWRTTTRGDDKLLIITLKDDTVIEGIYGVSDRELHILWEDDEMETVYTVLMLEY